MTKNVYNAGENKDTKRRTEDRGWKMDGERWMMTEDRRRRTDDRKELNNQYRTRNIELLQTTPEQVSSEWQ